MSNTRLGRDFRLTDAARFDIVTYWAERGFDVSVTVVPVSVGRAAGIYGLRSDMVNGLPVRRLESKGGAE